MRISDWSSDVCSSDLRAAEPQHGRTWRHLRRDRFVRRFDGGTRAMAARPEHGRTVFRCERTERPDDIDLIFAAVARRLPEILIAVRDLRERAFVQFDGLGGVADDPEIGSSSCRERGCQYV